MLASACWDDYCLEGWDATDPNPDSHFFKNQEPHEPDQGSTALGKMPMDSWGWGWGSLEKSANRERLGHSHSPVTSSVLLLPTALCPGGPWAPTPGPALV